MFDDPYMLPVEVEVIKHKRFTLEAVAFVSTRLKENPRWEKFVCARGKRVWLPHRYYKAFDLENLDNEISVGLMVEWRFGDAALSPCPFPKVLERRAVPKILS